MQIFPKTFKTSQLILIKLLFNLFKKVLILLILLILSCIKLRFMPLRFTRFIPITKFIKTIIPKVLNEKINMLQNIPNIFIYLDKFLSLFNIIIHNNFNL